MTAYFKVKWDLYDIRRPGVGTVPVETRSQIISARNAMHAADLVRAAYPDAAAVAATPVRTQHPEEPANER